MALLFCSLAGALLVEGTVTSSGQPARALPPAGSDVVPLVASVDAVSLLGETAIVLTGWMQVERNTPDVEDGLEVMDLEIAKLHLQGASPLGFVSVADRSADGPVYASRGEVRSLQEGRGFPASSSLDLFVTATAPASSLGPFQFYNASPLHLSPRRAGRKVELDRWPPLGVTYQFEPVFAVDNDGDGAVDEDTADDDGDGFIDEDRPGPDPDAALWDECGDDADCDGSEGEDPPADLCAPAICDGDADGLVDEDPSCQPLFGPERTHLKLGLCVRDLSLEMAPALPSYSVARGGPSRLHPADIFALTPSAVSTSSQAPFLRLSCASLGLSADGCDDGGDGDQDDVDALSYGTDLLGGEEPELHFSVGPGAQGAAGSAVQTQRNCPPGLPGASPEPEPDVFRSQLDGTNEHLLDGNGPIGACAPAFPLGLVEAAAIRDDLDALDAADSSAVDADGDGVPEKPVYFSLDAASPSLSTFGVFAADVLVTADGAPPAVFASAAGLGLTPGDDLDALCLGESGDARFGADDTLVLSLRPGSPTLAQIGAGPGDVLTPGRPPRVVQRAAGLGLLSGDDVDALVCQALAGGEPPDGDVDCNGRTDSVDAALVLQYDAGLIDSFRCPQAADVNGDGSANGLDAVLILELEAGLLDRFMVA